MNDTPVVSFHLHPLNVCCLLCWTTRVSLCHSITTCTCYSLIFFPRPTLIVSIFLGWVCFERHACRSFYPNGHVPPCFQCPWILLHIFALHVPLIDSPCFVCYYMALFFCDISLYTSSLHQFQASHEVPKRLAILDQEQWFSCACIKDGKGMHIIIAPPQWNAVIPGGRWAVFFSFQSKSSAMPTCSLRNVISLYWFVSYTVKASKIKKYIKTLCFSLMWCIYSLHPVLFAHCEFMQMICFNVMYEGDAYNLVPFISVS